MLLTKCITGSSIPHILWHLCSWLARKASSNLHIHCMVVGPVEIACLAADVVQKIQDWLKESGQLTDHSLAAFQRNPAGPK